MTFPTFMAGTATASAILTALVWADKGFPVKVAEFNAFLGWALASCALWEVRSLRKRHKQASEE